MRQHRWIELFSDYDCTIPSSFKGKILAAQKEACDESAGLQRGLDEMIERRSDGALYYLESNMGPFEGDRYWWPGMKKDIIVYQPEIPKWKREGIAMDIVTKLSRTSNGHDTILVIAEFGEGRLIGPEFVQETTEKISQIKDRLKATRDRQKSYVDKRRKPPEFNVGDYIIEKVGPVAYRLRLPEELNDVHDTFNVSNLKKCLADLTLQVPLDEIQVDAKLNFVEEPMEILEREFKKLKRIRIVVVKVWCNSKRRPEFT
ncbi:hypothetical protein Tco_0105149 [Tanacetum coccineum]